MGPASSVKLRAIATGRRVSTPPARLRTRSFRRDRLPAARDPASGIHPFRRRTGDSLRRGFDILLSAVALALLTPVFVAVAILVRATSPGPVFYHQLRVGQDRRRTDRRDSGIIVGPHDRRRSERRLRRAHGRSFTIHKFRTMVMDAEEYGPRWSSRNDPRVTPFGRVLRLTRLDETPQFLNVLRGEMSIVGPRPERPYFVDQFAENIPNYVERLTVRPGITGRAQVTLEYDASIDDVKKKLEEDLAYVRMRSLRQDLAILLRTIGVVLTGKGAC